MRRAIGVALVALALPGAALAGEKYDIPWFVSHPGERAATIRMCQDDYRVANNPLCGNASAAADRVWGKATTNANVNPLTTPRYWIDHPTSRQAVLEQCARRAPGDEMQFRWCAIAATAATMASR